VREDRRYLVTAHGRPVARLLPAAGEDEIDHRVREAAKRELLRRLDKQPVSDLGPWTRDALYERRRQRSTPISSPMSLWV
jgi:antitoxin (DNA-binding transcriptional repressor) of toxin-antitoxin stability system